MRLEINAGGLSQFFSNVSSFVSANAGSPSTDLMATLQTVVDRTNNLEGGVGSLNSVVQFVRNRKALEETRRTRIQTVQRKTNEFIDIARDTDNRVAALVNASNEAFYSVNPWARPQSDWSRFWNGVGNGARTIWDWTSDIVSTAWDGIVDFVKENWKVIVAVVAVLAIIAVLVFVPGAALFLLKAAMFAGKMLVKGAVIAGKVIGKAAIVAGKATAKAVITTGKVAGKAAVKNFFAGGAKGVTNRFTQDIVAFVTSGKPFGTIEDYAIAFTFGGVTNGMGARAKFVIDVVVRPMVSQGVRSFTRGEEFSWSQYGRDLLIRAPTFGFSEDMRIIARGLLYGYTYSNENGSTPIFQNHAPAPVLG